MFDLLVGFFHFLDFFLHFQAIQFTGTFITFHYQSPSTEEHEKKNQNNVKQLKLCRVTRSGCVCACVLICKVDFQHPDNSLARQSKSTAIFFSRVAAEKREKTHKFDQTDCGEMFVKRFSSFFFYCPRRNVVFGARLINLEFMV